MKVINCCTPGNLSLEVITLVKLLSYKNIDEWLSAINNNEIVGIVFIDLSKAIDLVDHDILLEKLKLYGMHETTVKWFSSYLKDINTHMYLEHSQIMVKLFLVCPKVQYSRPHCF